MIDYELGHLFPAKLPF